MTNKWLRRFWRICTGQISLEDTSQWLRRTLSHELASSHGQMAVRDRYDDVVTCMSEPSPVIVDGGSHTGGSISAFLDRFSDPVIHGFEPIPDKATELKERFADYEQVSIHEKALGETNTEVSFNVLENSVASAPRDTNTPMSEYYSDAVEREISVEQVRLDEFLQTEVDLLNLEIQGSQLAALRGAENLYSTIEVVSTSFDFIQFYEEGPTFREIDQFLTDRHFQLLNLYDLYTEKDGQLVGGVAVYR